LPKRVLTILNYYHPYLSGLSEHTRLIAEGLAGAGCQMTVLTGRHDPGLPKEELLHGVRVIRAEPWFFLHKGYLSTELFSLFQELSQAADLLHLHLPMLEAGPLAMGASSQAPVVATYHCDVTPQRSGNAMDWAAVTAVRLSARLCLRRADRITVTSVDYAASSPVLRGFESKWTVIHPPDESPAFRPRVAPPPGAPRVGFLGRFAAEKGLDILLDAVPLVLRHVPGARFILAGNHASVAGGSEYRRLEARITALGAAVRIPGIIPAAELSDFYRSLDVFVLPSVDSYEAFGMVQIEAMKAGVPVVATDRPGVRVPLTLTGNGILVPPGDAAALAGAITQILSARERFAPDRVAAAAWRVFPPGKPVEQMLACYQSAMHERAGRR
jgi:glycosyltransferase involved in cell wall biosynthesis